MKIKSVAIALVLTALLCSCPPQSARYMWEVQDQLRELVQKEFVKCGDSYYLYWVQSEGAWSFIEFTGLLRFPSWESVPDRANGIEWQGCVWVVSVMSRTYTHCLNAEMKDCGWGDWKDCGAPPDPDDACTMATACGMKKKGEWVLSFQVWEFTPDIPAEVHPPFTCGDVPM